MPFWVYFGIDEHFIKLLKLLKCNFSYSIYVINTFWPVFWVLYLVKMISKQWIDMSSQCSSANTIVCYRFRGSFMGISTDGLELHISRNHLQ